MTLVGRSAVDRQVGSRKVVSGHMWTDQGRQVGSWQIERNRKTGKR